MRSLPALAFTLLALIVAGCGGDDASDSSAAATPTTAAGTKAAFPVTVQHRYGATTIAKAPRRIVTVGSTEQDVVLSLGEKPIGVTEWYGDQPSATWPWAQAALGDAKPAVLHADDGINIEAVA